MKQAKREKDTSKYIIAFAITLIIFILGIYVGDNLNKNKVNEIKNLNDDIKKTTLALQTQYELVADNPCKVVNDTFLFKELMDVSLKVEYMENQLGQTHPAVKAIKEYYSTLLIQQWIFTNKIEKQCPNENIKDIIYFYSTKEECPYCESQGYILSNVRKDFPNVRVFAFDYNLKNPALKTLQTLFIDKVKNFPIVIIDGKTNQGFMNRAKILNELNMTDN